MKDKLPAGMMKRGDSYYACFRCRGKLVRRKLSKTLRTAKSMLIELRARYERLDAGIVDNTHEWDEMKDSFLEWVRVSLAQPGDYERDLDYFEKYLKPRTVRDITPKYVKGYQQWRRIQQGRNGKPISPRTINREVATLRNMLNRAVEDGEISFNPIAGIKSLKNDDPKKNRRALEPEEVTKLFEVTPPYLRPVWRMFATTGMRKSELTGLTFDDIDFQRGTVSISAARSKTGKGREIPLDDEMLETLTRLKEESLDRQPVPGTTAARDERQRANFSKDHVFVTMANTPWHYNLLARFYTYCRKAGIKDAYPGGAVDIHALRGTFTSLALDGGANLKAVQEILGHAKSNTTIIHYAKANDRTRREAVAALPFASVKSPAHLLAFTVPTEFPAKSKARNTKEKPVISEKA